MDINAAPVPDFVKEMAAEEGLDRDLELELENLTFQEDQMVAQKTCSKDITESNTKKDKENIELKGKGTNDKNKSKSSVPHVMPSKNVNPDTSPPAPYKSHKGTWKTTRHGIKKNYGPSHPQNCGCKVCGKLLPSRGELNEHHRRNHLAVLCPVCKKSFSSPNIRDRHIYSHNLNKQFICDVCKESFTFESELSTHKIIHRTLKIWICVKKGCGKDFKQKGDLVAHAKSHTNRDLICTICNNFTMKVEKHLTSHLRSHTKELKYKCKICGKGFVWMQQVKRHIEKEHN